MVGAVSSKLIPVPGPSDEASSRVVFPRWDAGLRGWRGLVGLDGWVMAYTVKEIFYTIQGEGANMGRPAVFIRFAGCNLWSGRGEDRATAVCRFCDTDFVGGTKYATAYELASAAASLWPAGHHHRMVVLTGGEPLLQVDATLLEMLRTCGFYTAVETNGTMPLRGHVDWLCVSPKAGSAMVLRDADELKLVYPQTGGDPELFAEFSAVYRWLSPRASVSPNRQVAAGQTRHNTASAAAYCRSHPEWRLAIQAHKFWKIP